MFPPRTLAYGVVHILTSKMCDFSVSFHQYVCQYVNVKSTQGVSNHRSCPASGKINHFDGKLLRAKIATPCGGKTFFVSSSKSIPFRVLICYFILHNQYGRRKNRLRESENARSELSTATYNWLVRADDDKQRKSHEPLKLFSSSAQMNLKIFISLLQSLVKAIRVHLICGLIFSQL